MKQLFTLLTILFLTQFSTAQVTYYTGWDDATEQSGWQQIRKGDASLYEWIYETAGQISTPNSLAHYYPVGGSTPTIDWFVSPAFDFTSGGSIDTIWSAFAGFGTPMAGDTIGIYLLEGSSDPDAAIKTSLYSYTDSVYQNDGVWRKDSNIVIPPTSGISYLAFRYETTVNWLDCKFDNLTVTADAILGGNELSNAIELTIFPNPVSDVMTIKSPLSISGTHFQIFSLSGQLVRSEYTLDNTLEVSDLEPGTYILSVITAAGLGREKFVISR